MSWEAAGRIVERMRSRGWVFRLVSTRAGTYIARFERRKFIQDPADEQGDQVHMAEARCFLGVVYKAARLAAEGRIV